MGLINLDYFTGNSPSLNLKEDVSPTAPKERKKRAEKEIAVTIAEDGTPSDAQLPMYQSNQPYVDTYAETNNMLRTSIGQIDLINTDVMGEVKSLIGNKTLKRKYDYLSTLTATSSNLISTKIAAIRELNKTTTDCHNLEMKRAKEIMGAAVNNVDDDKHILDMYNSFISAPVASDNNIQFAPTMQNAMNYPAMAVGNQDAAFNNYMNNISPVQNMMLHENNPNVKTVVKYDPNTGARAFDVIDMTTGQSMPNMPKPSEMFLEDTIIDLSNNIAKNTNLNTSYPLICAPMIKSTY